MTLFDYDCGIYLPRSYKGHDGHHIVEEYGSRQCENCGAPLNSLIDNHKCRYCGTIYS